MKSKRNVVALNQMSEHAGRSLIGEIVTRFGVARGDLAKYLGTSLVSVVRWERGDIEPDSSTVAKLVEILASLESGDSLDVKTAESGYVFPSRGARRCITSLPIFDECSKIEFYTNPKEGILSRLRSSSLWGDGLELLTNVLADHTRAAETVKNPATKGVSAGKNTYTYDAHTYHTKVPPQGIAEVIKSYLPDGGVVLDPFAGSGMTGVAARALGFDVILNELSPAASFIADRFTRGYDHTVFDEAVRALCERLHDVRRDLYTTECRTCGKDTEILYTVWSYRVCCDRCNHEFLLWDHCRHYGRTVREHKILKEFPCPSCNTTLKKSRLKRTTTEPVLIGYKCCERVQSEHPLSIKDRDRIQQLNAFPRVAVGFVPNVELPDGVNLSQPKRHGLTSIDRFYTPRNLSAMSHIWREIHCTKDDEIGGFLAFVFTSLYQRVTRLSEFRFWGGSGNTANFNVPYIFNEANVFVTFERKARSIRDHLATTAQSYSGRCVIRTGSATDLNFLPDNSIDFVFTDPPFGANINYSEMNILWESWFGVFTDPEDEAIINRSQRKDVTKYGELMTASLKECHRVLRPGHWMSLVFMNSSEDVWLALRQAIAKACFSIERVDIFDKQHGTFKQFVSDNTAGCDLLLHCRKTDGAEIGIGCQSSDGAGESVISFLSARGSAIPKLPYLHVQREEEIDYRMLYSEFLSNRLIENGHLVDFASFRTVAESILDKVVERN